MHVLFCQIWKFFKNTFFYRTYPVAGSAGNWKEQDHHYKNAGTEEISEKLQILALLLKFYYCQHLS